MACDRRREEHPASIRSACPPAHGSSTPNSAHFARISSREKNPSCRNSSLPSAAKNICVGMTRMPYCSPASCVLPHVNELDLQLAGKRLLSVRPGSAPSPCRPCTCRRRDPPAAGAGPASRRPRVHVLAALARVCFSVRTRHRTANRQQQRSRSTIFFMADPLLGQVLLDVLRAQAPCPRSSPARPPPAPAWSSRRTS